MKTTTVLLAALLAGCATKMSYVPVATEDEAAQVAGMTTAEYRALTAKMEHVPVLHSPTAAAVDLTPEEYRAAVLRDYADSPNVEKIRAGRVDVGMTIEECMGAQPGEWRQMDYWRTPHAWYVRFLTPRFAQVTFRDGVLYLYD